MRRIVIVAFVVGCGDDPVHHLPDGPPSNAMPGIYVTVGDAIAVFAPDAVGDAAPVRTITGTSTGMSLPIGIAVDNQGLVYVANRTGSTVTAYAKEASGNVVPTRTLTATGMLSPESLVVDSDGGIFVGACPNCGASAGGDIGVFHFAAGQSTSDYAIEGTDTQLTNPGVALDTDRTLVVGNAFGGVIASFPQGAMGNAMPSRTFTPAGAQNLQGVIASGGVIAAVSPTDGIDLFDATTTGSSQAAAGVIPFTGDLTVQYPGGVFFDTTASPALLYVVDFSGNAIYIAQLSGSGTGLAVSNVRSIQGPSTTLASPLGIIVIR